MRLKGMKVSTDVSAYAKNHDYSIIHGKANIISENSFKTKWIPAITVGGVFRFNDHNVLNGGHFYENSVCTQNTRNGDIYVVGSKTITQISKHVPVLFTAGLRGTDASLWGLAGNAPNMTVRGFGSLALVFHGPYKSTIIAGTEVAQQPQQLKFGTATSPGRSRRRSDHKHLCSSHRSFAQVQDERRFCRSACNPPRR